MSGNDDNTTNDDAEPQDRAQHPPERRPLQFSLGSLMWFTFACSLYFSQATVFPWAAPPTNFDDATAVTTIFVAWLLMIPFYVRHRLWSVIVVHSLTPTLMMLFRLVALAVGKTSVDGNHGPWTLLLAATVAGCFVSTLVNFPASVLMVVVNAFETTRERRSN
jgi:hypothetical protein